jgi:hypothetical protein
MASRRELRRGWATPLRSGPPWSSISRRICSIIAGKYAKGIATCSGFRICVSENNRPHVTGFTLTKPKQNANPKKKTSDGTPAAAELKSVYIFIKFGCHSKGKHIPRGGNSEDISGKTYVFDAQRQKVHRVRHIGGIEHLLTYGDKQEVLYDYFSLTTYR